MPLLPPTNPGPQVRAHFVAKLLGEKPSPNAAVRVAVNRPPRHGEGAGGWHEMAAPDLEAALAFLASHQDHGDTYLSPAWTIGGKRAEHVVARRSLAVEVDRKSMPGSTPEERGRQAQDLLGATPCPHIAVDSGHGLHGHLLLAPTHRIEHYDDPEDGRRQFEILGRAWRLFLEDTARTLFRTPVELDHCHGSERVWRPPGGWNTKVAEGARTLTPDRTRWRPVLLRYPGRPEGLPEVANADLSFLIPFVLAAETEQAEAGDRRNGAAQRAPKDAGTADTSPFDPDLLPEALRRRWPLGHLNPSDADYAVAIELAKARQPREVAEAGIRARRVAACDPHRKGERADYVARTINAAYASAKCASSAEPPERTRKAWPVPPPRGPFPLDALPVAIRRYVEESARCLGCCVSLVALPVLVVLGSAIGTTRRIRLRGGARPWTEPSIFWGAIVAESGQLKSPALDHGLDLIRRHEAPAAQENEDARRHYEQALERYHRDVARFRRLKTGGEPPEQPQRPAYRRHVISDITVEALADRLADNSRGLLVARDELSAWLRSFDAYRSGGRGGDSAKWLELHNARPMSIDRKTGDRVTVHVPRAAASILGGIQPGTLARALTPEFFDNGLAARLLVTMPPPVQRRWSEAEVSDEALHAVEQILDRLLLLSPNSDSQPVDVVLTASGKAAWVQFFEEHAAQGANMDGNLAAAWSKAEGYAARLALLIHLIRQAADNPALGDGVDAEDIRCGASLARWFVREAERVYAVLRESGEDRDRRLLVDWVRAHGGATTTRDLARGPRCYRGNEATSEQALQDLVAANWGYWESVPPSEQGGRPTRRFVLRAEPTAPTPPTHTALQPERERGTL